MAGKRRLFVIGNWFKQRLLYPVHVWGMSVLRRIPQDGTFHQEGPIPVSYTHLRAHETELHLVCRLLLEKKKHPDNYQIVKA